MDINKLCDEFDKRREQREPRLRSFYDDAVGDYLIVQRPEANMWGCCNDIETIYANNMDSLAEWLAVDCTDDLPYLEPWIGTGVYANAFGCEYVWRQDNAPHTHYRYNAAEDLKHIEYPDWRKSPIMKMVLDAIDVLKERTRCRIPITCTDTQSPFDTATLILDATTFMTAPFFDEQPVLRFQQMITDLIIEFSNVQIERIGKDLAARPGHLMPSIPGFRGLSISDDNLAVGSPMINEIVALPFDQKLANAFDGLAIHSCGPWAHTMKKLRSLSKIMMIDCAFSRECDPNPNVPADVREALQGSGIIAKVRVGGNMEDVISWLPQVAGPGSITTVICPLKSIRLFVIFTRQSSDTCRTAWPPRTSQRHFQPEQTVGCCARG
jgi:hypothetical protein